MKANIKSIIMDILIVLSSAIGILLTQNYGNFMSSKVFLYYTIQSNIAILLISIVFLVYKFLNKSIPNSLYKVKFICTVGISITFLVFFFMLVPQMFGGYNAYLLSLENLTVHFISPLLAIISFIKYDKLIIKKFTYISGITMPIIYCFFIILLTIFYKEPLFRGLDGKNIRFPYFFMDYETNGWFTITKNIWEMGFFYWFVIIFIITILISKMYLKLSENSKKVEKI